MEYKVKSRLKHNGTVYNAGGVVEMDKEEAEMLVEDEVLEPKEDLSDMTKKELVQKAKKEEVDVKRSSRKADILEKLKKNV